MIYYNKDRLLCLSESLLKVIEQNKLNERGILKRFTIQCYENKKRWKIFVLRNQISTKNLLRKR